MAKEHNHINQFPLNITAKVVAQGVGQMHIKGTLYNFDSDYYMSVIDDLLREDIKTLQVHVNSPGGNVFAANDIVNAFEQFDTVEGYGGALVASAASLIAVSCDSFEMVENGQFMYHKPSAHISGNEDDFKSSLKLLSNITSNYKRVYAEKTGKTEAEIEEAWSKGDVWLTAEEAKSEGFITGITGKKDIDEQTALMIAACGAPQQVKISNKSKPKRKMENRDQIISKLKLAKDATDEQINTALEALITKASMADKLQATAKGQQLQAIDLMLEAAIEAKKINADQKEHYKVLAEKDFRTTKTILEQLEPVQKVSAQLGNDSKDKSAKQANWTMQDYLDNDMGALAALMESNPEKFKELEDQHYNN